jgi:spore germination protein YaaH
VHALERYIKTFLQLPLFFLVFSIVFTYLPDSVSAQQTSESAVKKIVIKQEAATTRLDAIAYTGEWEALIPVSVIQQYLNPSALWDGAMARLDVEYGGIKLSFPASRIANQYYVNIFHLEGVLGITLEQAGTDTVVIRKPPAAPKEKAAKSLVSYTREPWKPDGKINLVWDQLSQYPPTLSKEEPITGLDVLSPTWFTVTDESGKLKNIADIRYVEEAHAKGYRVWALVSNSFNPELTHKVLSSEQAQENMIKQLLLYADLYHLDGINIDFENIYDYDKDRFSAFVEKLSRRLKQHNLVVSIDITIPANTANWSKCYDRKRLGEAVDYVMVMTYDEYWSKSTVSGPVASLPWVENGLTNTLAFIPQEKLLLGIPFYTREWEESRDHNGKIMVKAKTLSMAAVQKILDAYNLQPVWLGDKGQHYVEYEKDNKRYRIWIEDSHSISLKAGLVQHYNLAGTASWRKGFEAPHIWLTLNSILKSE